MAELQRTVYATVVKTDDIEIHVSTLDTENGTFTEIREYVVSLGQYGRGITFPARLTDDVRVSLDEVAASMIPKKKVASG